MSTITLDKSRKGLAGFPSGYQPVGRDDLGDPLAVDAAGRVWSFRHGSGAWNHKSAAFESVAQLQAYVAFQSHFAIPDEEGIDALRERRRRIEELAKTMPTARYARDVIVHALRDVREAIAERRFWSSKRGQGIAARQALGQRCEQALRDAGAPGPWLVRAHVERARALVVVGRFAAPWTEARVRALLVPVVGKGHELVCRERPQEKS